jgi:hypothetical protein
LREKNKTISGKIDRIRRAWRKSWSPSAARAARK